MIKLNFPNSYREEDPTIYAEQSSFFKLHETPSEDKVKQILVNGYNNL